MSWPTDSNAALTNLCEKKLGGKLAQWWAELKWFFKVTAHKKKNKAYAEAQSQFSPFLKSRTLRILKLRYLDFQRQNALKK